uniref:Uncharacterized protein n=1 Tax=Oryza meridionalis TaxID=40149 RepID=A0A0E0D8H2_9ORYZ
MAASPPLMGVLLIPPDMPPFPPPRISPLTPPCKSVTPRQFVILAAARGRGRIPITGGEASTAGDLCRGRDRRLDS